MTLPLRHSFPFSTRATGRARARRWHSYFGSLECRERRQHLPHLEAKRLTQAFDGLHLNLWLPAAFELLVELEFETDNFRHLLLRQISSQPKVAKVLGKLLDGSHCPC